MNPPEGFTRVEFDLTRTGDPEPRKVTCLVCNVCQAIILQNQVQDYVEAHRLWHQHLSELFKAYDEQQARDIHEQ